MKKRVISAIVMLAIVLPAIFLSEITRVLLFLAAGLLCTWEYTNGVKKQKGIHSAAVVLYVHLAAQAAIVLFDRSMEYNIICLVMAMFSVFAVGIFDHNVQGEGAVYSLAGLLYPGFVFTTVMFVGKSDIWFITIIMACISTWVCDSFAMFGGKLFGKHKLAPLVSPNKTVEGTLSGAVFSMLAGLILYLTGVCSPLTLTECVLIALAASSMGQIGDLAESLLKRMLDMKDFSNLIPGHGGVFDRCDSLLFSIPTAYLLISILM